MINPIEKLLDKLHAKSLLLKADPVEDPMRDLNEWLQLNCGMTESDADSLLFYLRRYVDGIFLAQFRQREKHYQRLIRYDHIAFLVLCLLIGVIISLLGGGIFK